MSSEVLQLLISGISQGCVYGLVALGFVLIYKATEMVNFAQGDLMMFGAFIAYTFLDILQWPFFWGVAATFAVMAVIGIGIERLFMRRMIGEPPFAALMLTIGLSFLLRALAGAIWGGEPHSITTPYGGGVFALGELVVGYENVAIVIGTALLCGLLFLFFKFTTVGTAMQAASQNQLAAEMNVEVAATSAHKPTETEFTATVLRLRNAGCDVVFMGTVYRDTVLVLEAVRKMGWDDVSFVGNDVTYGDVVADVQSGAAEGFAAFGHIAELYRDDDLSDEVAAWYDRYEERFGEKPVVAAVEGYRGADLVVTALEIAGNELTHDTLIAAMESITDYEDMFGYKLSFGPDDHKGVGESVLSVVEGGRWVTKAESVSY